MLSNEITAIVGANPKRKRVGRGTGSGHGKTAGRGHKGDGSRAGGSKLSCVFEGGQMPLFRRLPKRGFNNASFDDAVRSGQCVAAGAAFRRRHAGRSRRVARRRPDRIDVSSRVKILGDGELTKKLNVTAHKFSKSAEEKIAGCGGTAKVVA